MQNVAEWTFGIAVATLLVTIFIAYYNRYTLIYTMEMFEFAKIEFAKSKEKNYNNSRNYNTKNYNITDSD